MKKVIFTLTIISIVLTLFSIVNDPFSIPFQDWDQMPKETQEMYINKSKDMKQMRDIFGVCSLIGATYLSIIFIFKKKNKETENE